MKASKILDGGMEMDVWLTTTPNRISEEVTITIADEFRVRIDKKIGDFFLHRGVLIKIGWSHSKLRKKEHARLIFGYEGNITDLDIYSINERIASIESVPNSNYKHLFPLPKAVGWEGLHLVFDIDNSYKLNQRK